jgi:peroxiredoxin
METVLLKYGSLAPNFTLSDAQGRPYTRSQFRNKCGLALVFLPSTQEAASATLITELAKDADAYRKLNAKILIITRSAPPGESVFPTLHDADGKVWETYSGLSEPGYGVYVLDRYGGVDWQVATVDSAALPTPEDVRDTVQTSMFKCSI